MKNSDCVEWTGSIDRHGYGRKFFRGKNWLAHRYTWVFSNGEIPEDLCVLHRCDNRKCVNVEHLFLGTKKDNTQDMIVKGCRVDGMLKKDSCPAGHPYDLKNTYINPSGGRVCRKCNVERSRSYKLRIGERNENIRL